MARDRYAARHEGRRRGVKRESCVGVWSEWEGACADGLCRGGHSRPPLRPEMAASAQMQFVMG